ncbi:hypothetical protein [Peribacillus frigoritolerans]|uniref:hypothetical protein n=1 Tax=Peribacillus frigoritolerans TaxID=450367 RepID=UPI002EA61C0A|nr:hypothetical protein [Peribacillus frigoritolerans]
MELKDYFCMRCDWEVKQTKKFLDGIRCPECNQCTVMPGIKLGIRKKEKTIQEAAKEKVIALLTEYDVAYIDYDAKDNEYSIHLDKEKLKDERVYVDGVADPIYTNIKASTYKSFQQETND